MLAAVTATAVTISPVLDVDFDGGVTGGADIDGVNGGEIGGVLGVGAGDGVGKKVSMF